MPHYHICWSSKSTLDWEAFPSYEEAQAQAEQLVLLGESYVIEQVDGDCPQCSSLLTLPTVRSTSRDQRGTSGPGNPSRPWREIAKEVSEAQSPERFWELTIELDKALEAEEKRRQQRGNPTAR